MKRLLILGATSALAQHTARLFAARHDAFYLIARDGQKLLDVAADLRVRGAGNVETLALDLTDAGKHKALWDTANQAGPIDIVLLAYGTLPNQKECEASPEAALNSYQVNLLSAVSLLTLIANDFEGRKRGVIAVISSVAGERGRQSNYVYGSAKGALTLFLQGLRNRLSGCGVTVITIKPGMVSTPMTAHMKPSPLFASPEAVAQGIFRAIEKKKDVAYLPGYWRGVMGVIKMIPEPIFKKLKL